MPIIMSGKHMLKWKRGDATSEVLSTHSSKMELQAVGNIPRWVSGAQIDLVFFLALDIIQFVNL